MNHPQLLNHNMASIIKSRIKLRKTNFDEFIKNTNKIIVPIVIIGMLLINGYDIWNSMVYDYDLNLLLNILNRICTIIDINYSSRIFTYFIYTVGIIKLVYGLRYINHNVKINKNKLEINIFNKNCMIYSLVQCIYYIMIRYYWVNIKYVIVLFGQIISFGETITDWNKIDSDLAIVIVMICIIYYSHIIKKRIRKLIDTIILEYEMDKHYTTLTNVTITGAPVTASPAA